MVSTLYHDAHRFSKPYGRFCFHGSPALAGL